MTRILCCWFPNWPIQRRQSGRPELNGQAVAVYASDGRRGDRVVACCGRAYRYGVRPQMPLAEAKAIAGRRRLVIDPHDPAADRRALERLAERCEQFSPAVALEEDDAPESLLLDVTGLEHLLGSEAELAGRLAECLNATAAPSPKFRIAVAGTVGAAWAMAHFAHALDPPPSSPVIVPSGADHLLLSLPVDALRLSGEMIELLTQLGIMRIEQLLELPRESLAARFGDELLRRVDQLTGCMAEVIRPHRPPAPFAAEWLVEHPTTNRLAVRVIVRRLLDQLVERLVTAGEGAVQLTLTLGCGRQPPLGFRIGLFRPSADAAHLLELVEMQLENMQVPEPIDRVELAAPVTARLAMRQHELFADDHAARSRELALLVDRLSSRLGPEAVVQPQLGKSALPERACRWMPLAGGGKVRSSADSTTPSCPSRPLSLHEPRPIELVSIAPDGPPQCVWLDHQRLTVVQSWGPERIETGWWRGPPVARDYYRIETESGSRLWVFRRLRDGRWFAQGEFV